MNHNFVSQGLQICNEFSIVARVLMTKIKNMGVCFSTLLAEVELTIARIKCKSMLDYYSISTKLLKAITSCVINPLVTINSCIMKGTFPKELRIIKVLPINKKGNCNDADNCRPSITSISRILEIAIADRLLNFLERKETITNAQHGVRKNKSTIRALTDIMIAILEKHVRSTCCDLNRAFGMVDHEVLLNKLFYLEMRESTC